MKKPLLIGLAGPAGSGKDTAAGFLKEELSINSRCFLLSFAQPIKAYASNVFGFNDETLTGSSSKRDEIHTSFGDPIIWDCILSRHRDYAAGWVTEILDKSQIEVDVTTLLRKTADWLFSVRTIALLNKGLNARYVLQSLGTDCFRASYPDIWATYGINSALKLQQELYANVIITDVRFLSEAKLIRANDGEVIRLTRVSSATGISSKGKEHILGQREHISESECNSSEIFMYYSKIIDNVGTIEQFKSQISDCLADFLRNR